MMQTASAPVKWFALSSSNANCSRISCEESGNGSSRRGLIGLGRQTSENADVQRSRPLNSLPVTPPLQHRQNLVDRRWCLGIDR